MYLCKNKKPHALDKSPHLACKQLCCIRESSLKRTCKLKYIDAVKQVRETDVTEMKDILFPHAPCPRFHMSIPDRVEKE